jgi:transcriptional antiterminator Rof (Rho-off)
MVLAQASMDACNDPLDHLQGSGASIACLFHLSVYLTLTNG